MTDYLRIPPNSIDAEQSAEARAVADRLRAEIERPAGIGEQPVQGRLL